MIFSPQSLFLVQKICFVEIIPLFTSKPQVKLREMEIYIRVKSPDPDCTTGWDPTHSSQEIGLNLDETISPWYLSEIMENAWSEIHLRNSHNLNINVVWKVCEGAAPKLTNGLVGVFQNWFFGLNSQRSKNLSITFFIACLNLSE